MLSHIQQEQPFQVSWDKPPPADKEELSLSTAFATIAVIDHEIVAVVTKHNCDKVEVVLSPQIPIKDPSTNPSSWMQRGFKFFVTRNPRLNDPPSTILPTDEPTISRADNAGILPGIYLDDNVMLKTWIDQCW